MLIVVIYIIPEGRAAGSFQFLNLHHYMGITGKQDYVRVKLKTLLRAYGYQRRSAKLMTFLKQGMERYGLVSYLRGNQRCDIEEIRLDDMISFRVKSNG